MTNWGTVQAGRWLSVCTALAMIIGIWVLIEATSSARAAVTTTETGLRSVCPPDANVVTFNVAAINVDITLNRFGDHDPKGKMYVLQEDIPAVRAQEHAPLPDRVSIGLRDDPIQPLIVRANLGDCVKINLKNQLPEERASIHFHRGKIDPANGGDNVGNNPDSTIGPGESSTYTVYIPDRREMEGTFYFHSHGDARDQVMHGLLGGLVGEPKGSVYLHPDTLMPLKSGWEAVIGNNDALTPAFREQALVYHEVGDETYTVLDKNNQALPVVDPTTGAYRPCARAINYRSECFMRRMELTGTESLAYSSYHAGDPPTPMPRSYVGDPMKTRLIHGGSEMPHDHHLHGGAVRWRFQPGAESPDVMYSGFVKQPEDTVSASQRLDVQSIGPGETYNLEHECGSGGCQQTAGEFLFHCHIPDHYVAGMWSFWRTYNTLQQDFKELPGRQGETPAPVSSVELMGKTLLNGDVLDETNIREWVESQLPPQGVPLEHDATVYDWAKVETPQGPLYLKEPEDTTVWANFSSDTPGQRREVQFNPNTGLLTFPFLSPHLGKRPPFAPGAHGPAPYLTTPVPANEMPTNSDHQATPPDPIRGDRALCPPGSPIKRFNLVAIQLPIPLNNNDVDPDGMIFVLAEEAEDVLAGRKPAHPLVLRVNVGDCVQNTLVNRLHNPTAKTNLHPHFFQFDTQASDGVITGLSYEQSIYPYASENRVLSNAAKAGQTQIFVTNTGGLRTGIWLGVGLGTEGIELHQIESISGNTIVLTEPLVRAHAAGEAAGVEFVRYALYADVLVGTVFVHDHVNGIERWQHGLVGTIIVEPKGSTYHDPKTGEKVRNTPIADVHTSNPVCHGCEGQSFREMALITGDWRTAEVGETHAWLNMRSEPFDNRGGDPSLLLSSVTHGDPSTPLLRAYEGDPVMVRFLSASPTSIMRTVRVTGHRFHLEYYDNGDGVQTAEYDTIQQMVSEKFDAVLDGGAGKAGDYLYYDTQAEMFDGGGWGIFRVHDTRQPDLKPLRSGGSPGSGHGFPSLTHTGGRPPEPPGAGSACPTGAPARTFDVHAVQANLVFNQKAGLSSAGRVFVPAEDANAVMSGAKRAEPLVLRAAAGDCVTVNLTNRLREAVSFHMGRVKADPQSSLGITVGYNYDQSVAPGRTRSYQYYVDHEVGAGIIADFAQLDHLAGMQSGLYGAIVTTAAGSHYLDPASGQPINAGTRAIVTNDDPAIPPYRDYALLFHESDKRIGTSDMPYVHSVSGLTAINYRTEPLSLRLSGGIPAGGAPGNSGPGGGAGGSMDGGTPSMVNALSSSVFGDPETPLLEAYEGDAVRIHVVQGYGFQTGTFALNGHAWPHDPGLPGSEIYAVRRFGPHEALDIVLDGGAGMPGDYLYQNHRLPYMEAGQWGIFRVHAAPKEGLLPLTPSSALEEPGQEDPTPTPTPPTSPGSGTGSGGTGSGSGSSGPSQPGSAPGGAPSGSQGSSTGGSSLGSGSAPTSPAPSVLQPLFRLRCMADLLQCVVVESNPTGGAGDVQTPANGSGSGETSGGPGQESTPGNQEPRFRLQCKPGVPQCS